MEAIGSDSRAQIVTEAAGVVPAVHQTQTGVKAAEAAGDAPAASILKQHLILLTALYAIAQDMGYEW